MSNERSNANAERQAKYRKRLMARWSFESRHGKFRGEVLAIPQLIGRSEQGKLYFWSYETGWQSADSWSTRFQPGHSRHEKSPTSIS